MGAGGAIANAITADPQPRADLFFPPEFIREILENPK